MQFFPVAAANGVQEFPIPVGQSGPQTFELDWDIYPTAGTVTIEYRIAGSSSWTTLATTVSLTASVVTQVTANVAAYRLTIASLAGGFGAMANISDYGVGFGASGKGAVSTNGNGFKTIFAFGSSSTYYAFTSDQIGGSCVSYLVRMIQKCGGAIRVIGGSGITGETSSAQVARLPSVIASWTVIPTYTILQIAGNDIISTDDMATVKSRINAMTQMVLDAGSIPILMTPNLLGAATGITAAQILRHSAINQHMTDLAKSDRRIRLADTSRDLADTTSIAYGPISTYMRADGLHTTNIGADQASKALVSAVSDDIYGLSFNAAMPGMLYDVTTAPYGNLLPNPFLNGSGGTTAGANVVIGTNIIGNIPTNMVLRHTAGAGSVTITTVARTDGKAGYWKRFTFTLAASENWALQFAPSVSPGANKTMFGMMETQIDTSGITAGYIYTLSARMRDGAASKTVWEAGTIAQATNAESAEPVHASRNEWRYVNPYLWPAFGSSGTLSLEFIATSTIAGTLVVDVACAGIFIANDASLSS